MIENFIEYTLVYIGFPVRAMVHKNFQQSPAASSFNFFVPLMNQRGRAYNQSSTRFQQPLAWKIIFYLQQSRFICTSISWCIKSNHYEIMGT